MTKTPDAVAKTLLERAIARKNDPREVWGISWGVPRLNKYTGGIQREEMTLLMARPGVGKTSMMEDITISVADWMETPDGWDYLDTHGLGQGVMRLVLIEMSAENFQLRLTCKLADVSLRDVREGKLTPEEWERFKAATKTVAMLPIEYLDDTQSLDQTARFLSQKDRPTIWWALDYLQIHPTGQRGQQGDTGAINLISSTLRDIAKNVAPGLVLSQMTREVDKREDKRPQLSDLRGSGQLEADAANVLGIYRGDIYTRVADEQRNEARPAELLLLKQRNGDSNVTIDMWWYPDRMTFEEAEKKSSK